MAQVENTLSGLLGLTTKNADLYDSFQKDPKAYGSLGNLTSSLSGLGEMGNSVLKQINSNPQKFQSDYDQYLQGQKMGNDPANTRPLYSSATNQWYDYAGSKWRDIGDGWGESKTPETPAPVDPTKPVTSRSRPGYSYGSENPYLMEMLGLQKPAVGSKYTPQGRKLKGKSQKTMDITDMLAKGGVYGNY